MNITLASGLNNIGQLTPGQRYAFKFVTGANVTVTMTPVETNMDLSDVGYFTTAADSTAKLTYTLTAAPVTCGGFEFVATLPLFQIDCTAGNGTILDVLLVPVQ